MMKTLYDADGNPKVMDSVDAREHLAMGGWFVNKPEQIVVAQIEEVSEVEQPKRKYQKRS
jgi:hypothetical protein